MTEPEQPEQPDVNESAAPLPEVQLSKAPESEAPDAGTVGADTASAEPETFAAHVERLVAAGKLTAAEAAELLEPQVAAPSAGQEAERMNRRAARMDEKAARMDEKAARKDEKAARMDGWSMRQRQNQSQDAAQFDQGYEAVAGEDSQDLRLEVAGYGLSVVHDPSLPQPRLTANRDGVLALRAGRDGWTIEVLEHHRLWGLRAVLSLPFTPRDVRAEVSGGNITLADFSGSGMIEVSGGNATLGTSGQLRAEVSGGNLTAGAVSGDLRLEINGGNMTVAGSTALRAEINGGQLSWTGLLLSGQHEVEVNGGQATLRLDAGSSVTVQAESTLGGVSASFPLQKSGGMMHATYSGTLGSGEARLECEVNAGQIRLVTA